MITNDVRDGVLRIVRIGIQKRTNAWEVGRRGLSKLQSVAHLLTTCLNRVEEDSI